MATPAMAQLVAVLGLLVPPPPPGSCAPPPRPRNFEPSPGWALGPPVGQETFPPYAVPLTATASLDLTEAEKAVVVRCERNRRAEERKRKNRQRARRR